MFPETERTADAAQLQAKPVINSVNMTTAYKKGKQSVVKMNIFW
jgi:hypothetical protein